MASVREVNSINVIIDGYSLDRVREFSLERDMVDIGYSWSSSIHLGSVVGLTHITVTTLDGVELKFTPEHQEIVQDEEGTTVYVFGVLRKMFPSLFADKDLLDWQKVYLEYRNTPAHYKYKLFRDDPVFLSNTAEVFRIAYTRGYAAGVDVGEKKGWEIGNRIGRSDAMQEATEALKPESKNRRKKTKWSTNI